MKHRYRLSYCLTAALFAFVLGSSTARALINPNYTPVDLVYQSLVILRLEIGPPEADGRVPVTVVEVLKGERPGRLSFTADMSDGDFLSRLKAALAERRKTPALLFSGDFSTAIEDDGELGSDGPVGAVQIGTAWFSLKADGQVLQLADDPLELKTVWAGSDAMLEKIVHYVQADPRADVPTNVGVRWNGDMKLADLAGTVGDCQAIDVFGDGHPCLFLAVDSGDRLYRSPSPRAAPIDVSQEIGLASGSRRAAWADLNGDGRLDLASWDGSAITVMMAGESGKLSAETSGVAFEGPCAGLTTFAFPGVGRASLLVATDNRPRSLTVSIGGDPALFSLPESQETGVLDPGGPCLVADFDGDGLPDVVQTGSGGLLLYRGNANGTFSPPHVACRIQLGQGVTTALTGDYDADQSLDIVLGGEDGCILLTNRGDGRFLNTLFEAGEVEYNTQAGVVDGTNCDINNDGRQDFVLFYKSIAAQTFFNRGFRCFGYALEVGLDRYDLPAALAAEDGQQAGTVADFNGDGAQDLAFVTTAGQVWLLLRATERGPGLGVSVALPPDQTGPISVVGFDRDRCLGAQRVTAGVPALFGMWEKGPVRLQWQRHSQPIRTKQVIVLKPTRFQLPGE